MKTRVQITITAVLLGAGLMMPNQVQAHCDTMDGPVVDQRKIGFGQERHCASPEMGQGGWGGGSESRVPKDFGGAHQGN